VSNTARKNKSSAPFVCHHVPDKGMCLIPEVRWSNVVSNKSMSKSEILHLEKLDHLQCLAKSHHITGSK